MIFCIALYIELFKWLDWFKSILDWFSQAEFCENFHLKYFNQPKNLLILQTFFFFSLFFLIFQTATKNVKRRKQNIDFSNEFSLLFQEKIFCKFALFPN